jgi:hypothetical protein
MASTKNYYDQMLENQNKFMKAFSELANETVDTVMPDKKLAEKTEMLVKEYFTKPYELVEDLGKKETLEKYQKNFWAKMTEDYTKSMELSKDLYQKTIDFYKEMWSQNTIAQQQEKMKRFTELCQNCMKSYMEATSVNAKVVQDYFKKEL